MKCQKCGNPEVNFHLSSNINGCLTETHLCSRCAAESGYSMEQMFDFGGVFNSLPFEFGERGVYLPIIPPVMVYSMPMSFAPQPGVNACSCAGDCRPECCEPAQETRVSEVDEQMKQRRELNVQMRIAVENEDFEKAAEIRDKLKELKNEI